LLRSTFTTLDEWHNPTYTLREEVEMSFWTVGDHAFYCSWQSLKSIVIKLNVIKLNARLIEQFLIERILD